MSWSSSSSFTSTISSRMGMRYVLAWFVFWFFTRGLNAAFSRNRSVSRKTEIKFDLASHLLPGRSLFSWSAKEDVFRNLRDRERKRQATSASSSKCDSLNLFRVRSIICAMCVSIANASSWYRSIESRRCDRTIFARSTTSSGIFNSGQRSRRNAFKHPSREVYASVTAPS